MHLLVRSINMNPTVKMDLLSRLLVRTNVSTNPTTTTLRYFRISTKSNGISDPFKPSSSKSTQDTKSFYASKLKKNDIDVSKENFFTRLIQKSLNPTPINNNLRDKFNLNMDYKLIYFIDRERIHMIVFGLMNSVFPIFFVLMGLFAYAEFTGQSQMIKSFDNPHLFTACVTGYFAFVFLMSRMAQARTIFRIYFNEKTGEFVMFRLGGLISFKSEKFTAKDAAYLFPPKDNEKSLIRKLQHVQGNVFIKNRLCQVEFKNFVVPVNIEKMLGSRAYNTIKEEMNKKT